MTTEELAQDATTTEELAQSAPVEEPDNAPLDEAEPVQGVELGAAGDPPVLIEPRAPEDPGTEEGVDLLTPTCGCTPAGCSWDLCDEDDELPPVEESWPEIGGPLVIEAPELAEVEPAPVTEVAVQSSPELLAETGAPVDGWALIVVGAALVFGGAVVAVSRWIGAKR